jgi:hypothetical protein
MGNPAPREKRSPARRAAIVAGWAAGVSAALVLGAAVVVQTPAFRGYVVSRINRELEGSMRGRIALDGLTRLGLGGAHVSALRVTDERGELVLELEDISVGFDLLDLLGAWLPSSHATIELEHARVNRSKVRLITDERTGALTLARALGRESSGPRSSEAAPLSILLSSVELGEVIVSVDHPAVGRHDVRIHHVRGSASVDGEDTEVTVQSFGVLLVENGTRWLDGTGSLRLMRKGVLSGGFHGFVRGTELDLGLQLDAEGIVARLDVPHARPEPLRDLWPGWPLRSPVAAHLTARGPFSAMQLAGYAESEGTRLDLTGNADVEGAPRAHLDITAHALDLRSVEPTAPRTALEAQGSVDVSQGKSGLSLVADVTTQPASIGALQLPLVKLSVRHEAGATVAHFELGDARGALAGDVKVAAGGGAEVTARLTRISLGAVPELGGGADGRLDGRLRARLSAGRFQGSADGAMSDLRVGEVAISSGTWRAGFDGRLSALTDTALTLGVTGSDVRVGPLRLDQAVVTGRGTARESRVRAELTGRGGARGSAEARLTLNEQIRIDDVELAWTERDLALAAHAGQWAPAAGILSVGRVTLTGNAGSLDGSARVAPGRVTLTADADHLDTDRIARALGVSGVPVRGIVTGRVRFSSAPGEALGELALQGEKVRIRDISVGSLDARATLSGQHVDLGMTATDASLGHLEMTAVGDLGGRPLELASWQSATGSGSVTLNRLPLWPVGLLVAQSTRVKDLDGRLDLSLKLERSDATALPDLFLQANTEALTFALASELAGESPRSFDGYGVHASASVNGRGGHGTATVLVSDEHGSLVTTSGSLDIDLSALLRDPETLLGRLFRTPLDALVRLHPRAISQLPEPFGVRDLAGSVEGTLLLRGSLAEPTLSLAAQGHQLQGGVSEGNRAVDVTSVLEYTPKTGRVRGNAEVQQDGRGLVSARVEGRVMQSPLEPGWSVEGVEFRAAAMLNGVPLELLPVAARERIEARLYGSIDIEKERGAPLRQRAHLEIANLSAQGHALGNGRLTFESLPDALRAELRVGTRQKYLRASVRGPAANAPGGASVEGSVDAHDFDAASLAPLTSGLLSRVGGVMNADLGFRLKSTGADWYLGIDGKARLDGGSAHIEELGLEVRDIAADLTVRSTPEYSVIQIDPLEAKARSRSPNVRGDVELWLRGLRVVNGETNLTLDDVPLSVKGVSRGIARGQVKARLERVKDYLSLEVKIPDLRVRLPASSTRTLIALEPNSELHVLQAAQEPSESPRDALLWKIQLDIGRNVRLQRADLNIPITGHPTIEYQYELRPSGTIEASPGGRITLFDQSFSIDRALVQFVPDEPDNPRVDVTASWRAPDGTTVYVDVTGRAKDATVLTRDDRGLQEVERFYLITGGAVSDGQQLADGGAADAGAIGQTFSLGINELLRNSLGNVAVRIGTTSDDRASYSASVRLSDKLSFQGSFQTASQSNLERSTNDVTGTLDYRFTRRWSLRTELGTSGGAFDLLWSHRY